ncbi:MAG TPA: hypothetical protein VFX76_07685, partial [Roseiflexaceae bacterium]|nr:hypothetical protein [Roseiflexaceae bacterium]
SVGVDRQRASVDAQHAAELIARGNAAQTTLAGWAAPSLADLLRDLAISAAERAEHLASTTLAEMGGGDLAGEIQANRRASRWLHAALLDGEVNLTLPANVLRSGNGMILGYVSQRYAAATVVAASLLAIGARRGLILSCHQAARQSCRRIAGLIEEVLTRHEAPHELLQWVQWGTGCAAVLEQMSRGGRAVILDNGSIE